MFKKYFFLMSLNVKMYRNYFKHKNLKLFLNQDNETNLKLRK